MRELTISTLESFVSNVEAFPLTAEFVIFRGQSVKGKLLPGIARERPDEDSTDKEKGSLEQLKLLGASLLPSSEASELDTLVRAQHYGLKTRLLDWTSNPLTALWFACSSSRGSDAYVYALDTNGLIAKNVYEQRLFGLVPGRTTVFQPRLNNARIVAQHGWFTLHRPALDGSGFVSLDSDPEIKARLVEYKIPEHSRPHLLASLDRHGVNSRALFPDLEGLCKYLNSKSW